MSAQVPAIESRLKPKTLLFLVGRYRHWFLKYQRVLWGGVACLVGVNAMGALIPWQIKHSIERLQQVLAGGGEIHSVVSGLWPALGMILALATVMLLCRIASRQLLLGTGRRMEADIRNELFAHLLRQPAAYFSAHPVGALMSRLTNDVDATKYLTGGGIMLGLNTILAYVMVLPMMWMISPPLTLATFVLYPLMAGVITRVSARVRQGYYQVQDVLADISTVAQENISGMPVIQSYAREEQESKRVYGLCDRYFNTYTRLIRQRIVLFMMLAMLSGLSLWVVLLVGGWQVIGGGINWGDFVAFMLYLERLAWSTIALGWTISIFQQGTAAMERLDEVLSTQPPAEPDLAGWDPHAVRGEIEFRGLTFAYPGPSSPAGTGHPVLDQLSLSIRAGETLAVVGPVGSGKSTLLRLLVGLESVPPGGLFLDGRDVTQIPKAALRQAVVMMPQLSFLFSTTVSRNMQFGVSSGPVSLDGVIVPAAQAAGIHEDVLALPAQYDTLVGERGLLLSGGQRQRVALTRAIVNQARVLVLDDPFASVDAETERHIVRALQERQTFSGRTTVLATHRFSLLALCDRVALLDAGRLVAVDTHERLLASQPLYQDLYRLQSLKTVWDEVEPASYQPEVRG